MPQLERNYGTIHSFPPPDAQPKKSSSCCHRLVYRALPAIVFFAALLLVFSPPIRSNYRLASANISATHDLQLLFQSTDLSEERCNAGFPRLFDGIDRHSRDARVSLDDLKQTTEELSEKGEEYVSAVVLDNQLRILYPPRPGDLSGQLLSALQSLHAAITSSPTALPNTAFIISPSSSASSPIWSFTKTEAQSSSWLIPSTYDPLTSASYSTALEVSETIDQEYAWQKERASGGPYTLRLKLEKLFWEGTDSPEEPALHAAIREQPWADVHTDEILPSGEQCRYKFIAHTQGDSTPLRFSQACTSVLFLATSEVLEHNTEAMLVAKGDEQNYVEVKEDWTDVAEKIEYIRDNPQLAEEIARRGWMAGRRYNSAAADACYWRRLVNTWGSSIVEVSAPEVTGLAWDTFITER